MRRPGNAPAPVLPAPPDALPALCVFGAFCVFLSALEYLFPRPLPYMRLGLANLPLMLALFFKAGDFALLVLVKALIPALLFGTLFSYIFLFSIAGSAASALLMFALYRLFGANKMSFIGLGICGALSSTAAQLVVARYLALGKGAVYLAPPLLAAGALTGGVLGVFANQFSARSRWYQAARQGAALTLPAGTFAPPSRAAQASAAGLFCAGAAGCAALTLINDLRLSACAFAGLLALSIALKKKNHYLFTALFMASIVACNLLAPFGKVLWSWGSLRLTEGALREGARKALTIEALLFMSRLCVSKHLRLPGIVGRAAGGTLFLVAVLQERRRGIRRERLLPGIDALLCDITGLTPPALEKGGRL